MSDRHTDPTPADVLFSTQAPQPKNEMFPVDVALRPAFLARDTEKADTLGLRTVERRAEEATFTRVIGAAGLDGATIGKTIWDRFVDARIAEAHGRDPDEDTLTDRMIRDAEEVRQTLAGTYGRERGEELLARAQRFVRSHPALAQILRQHGIGSRPDVVIPIADYVHRVNWK